jgi:hypothetical protein
MTRYIAPILLLLLAVAINGFYIQPLYKDILAARAKEVEVNRALSEVETAQAKLDEITKRYESFPTDADAKLAQIFPEKIDPIRLLIDTTAFLEKNGFSAKGITVSDGFGASEGGGQPYRAHAISFTLTASYETFKGFLHVLEGSLALRDLSTLSFSSGASVDASGKIRPDSALHDYAVQVTSYSLR